MKSASEDDTPLPRGYRVINSRRCSFELVNTTGGIKGLSMAILLRAVEDGCNPKWLKEISEFYEIPVPPEMFDRRPAHSVVVNQGTNKFTPVSVLRGSSGPLLSWGDGFHITQGLVSFSDDMIGSGNGR